MTDQTEMAQPQTAPAETATGEAAPHPEAALHPIRLSANQPTGRFYRGGARIAAFRNAGAAVEYTPEDWVASTTSVRGQGTTGQTRLESGELLADAIERSPRAWLGDAHLDAFGVDTMLLVKLLDAGQRLPVHAHPGREFALSHLGSARGKAEAWYLLNPGTVHLGLTRDVSIAELRALVDAQDVEGMLGIMHEVAVEAHQTVFVPPGVLHAIGEGILLAEVQEPQDLSILLEWRDFELDGENDGHLDLGFDAALTAVETRARTRAQIDALIGPAGHDGDCLPGEAHRYFQLERLTVDGETLVAAGYAVLITVAGAVDVVEADGAGTPAEAGATVVLPHSAGAVILRGEGVVLVARPPAPASAPGTRP
ncbi:class I mannose-6-phosphate isomerase [Compostimonas suwonensis]|uniref:Mannose-6-phosphate isomerase n=1 Tax=Compostimonas suwonensis TaxID=1048394 RepID=A0A2M9BCY5_9MICO|nr:class I mannose-6-phosphate isomerase [Compostimonas suwonensis]PJJ55799.1 mannose-6-phosphate isomerase [Compostimonas suwonensis]